MSALVAAAALTLVLATPALAADSAFSPTSPLDRVLAVVDTLVKRVQDAVCLTRCQPAPVAPAKTGQPAAPAEASEAPGAGPPTAATPVGEVFGAL